MKYLFELFCYEEAKNTPKERIESYFTIVPCETMPQGVAALIFLNDECGRPDIASAIALVDESK